MSGYVIVRGPDHRATLVAINADAEHPTMPADLGWACVYESAEEAEGAANRYRERLLASCHSEGTERTRCERSTDSLDIRVVPTDEDWSWAEESGNPNPIQCAVVGGLAVSRDWAPASMRPQVPRPDTAAVRAYLKQRGITGAEAARRGYLSGGQVVRKYTGGARPHQISGAVWFSWHAHELLDAETIARIEAAMEADAGVGG